MDSISFDTSPLENVNVVNFILSVDSLQTIRLDDYDGVCDKKDIDSVRILADSLKGKSVTHVNSTAFGGGVAEILNSMVPLMKDVGLGVHWEVISGSYVFFSVTKKIHNALQGMNVKLTDQEQMRI